MTAPVAATHTAKVSAIPIEDGFSTQVIITADPNIVLWEKTVTPPGLDGGEAVNTTTMLNTLYRTFAPRKLMTLTPVSFTAAYDPLVYTELLSVINVRTTITVLFPDGSTLAFYGYVQKADMGQHVEGTEPEMTVTIVPTNEDPTTKAEEAPVLTSVAGT